MNREQKEKALVDALNKATDSSKGFFLYHLGMYSPKPGKIRDQIMALDDEDFDLFYNDEIDNLKAGLVE
jgi:hypothetical protein